MSKTMHRWTRLSSLKWEDAWQERLRFLAPSQLAFMSWPESRALKIEAYCDEKTARHLVKTFGGRITRLTKEILTGDLDKPRAPLPVRGKLKVYSNKEDWAKWREKASRPPGIFVPAGMAFGTGEHATTATCLRLLADTVPSLPENFSATDLGTGSGILAIAAETLGAGSVEAMDNDPACVRIAKENARTNGCRKLKVVRGSAPEWRPQKNCHLALANLYSDLLIATAPTIASLLLPPGILIFSGVLRSQADEVCRALQKAGFSKPRVISRGKWCAGICQLRGKK